MLLFKAHLDGIFMRIAVEPSAEAFIQHHDPPLSSIAPIHLMPCISYHCTFLGESLQRVSRDEPCGLDVILCKQLQETANANRTSEKTSDQSA